MPPRVRPCARAPACAPFVSPAFVPVQPLCFPHLPTFPELSLEPLRRLRLPLPFGSASCSCGRALDELGDHRSACLRSGALRLRAGPLERATARVCCEARPSSRPWTLLVKHGFTSAFLGLEVGGRWSAEAAQFVSLLARSVPGDLQTRFGWPCSGPLGGFTPSTVRRLGAVQHQARGLTFCSFSAGLVRQFQWLVSMETSLLCFGSGEAPGLIGTLGTPDVESAKRKLSRALPCRATTALLA